MHIMLDLETMGNGPNAPIVSVGAVEFTQDAIFNGCCINVDLQSCLDIGMEIDGSTVMWWLSQSDEARAALKRSPKHIAFALQEFTLFCGEDAIIWGNGATFDNVILSSAYRKCLLKRPWSYKSDRCFRTIKAMYPEIEIPETGTKHNALDDARWQAEYLIALCRENNITLR